MAEEKKESFGKCQTPEGLKDIIDYFETENIDGRQWRVVRLDDNSFVIAIESKPENSFETVNQQMRLSLKSFALLALVMAESDRHFELKLEAVLTKMLKGAKDVKIKMAKQENADSSELNEMTDKI